MRDNKGRFTKGHIEKNKNKFRKGNKIGFKHGLRSHGLYKVWGCMRNRCNNPNSDSWPYYGGKGIEVCNDWDDFTNFYNWAIDKWECGLQLDRINNSGNYEPSNCRFVTPKEKY